jgi:hypothetical protein
LVEFTVQTFAPTLYSGEKREEKAGHIAIASARELKNYSELVGLVSVVVEVPWTFRQLFGHYSTVPTSDPLVAYVVELIAVACCWLCT